MANGFDRVCADALLKIKNEKNIEIIGCVPCKEQDKYFNKKQKEEYKYLLENLDDVIILGEEYYNGCMQVRNRYMVDNSSLVIAYSKTDFGGTYYTVKYAEKQKKEIVYV